MVMQVRCKTEVALKQRCCSQLGTLNMLHTAGRRATLNMHGSGKSCAAHAYLSQLLAQVVAAGEDGL